MICSRLRLFLPLLFVAAAQASDAADRPNVVFILVDDLGYMDIGANNPETFYETPNIDKLAGSGMRFTNGYAANPVCSPTRYSIMTGKYPSRVDATNFFAGKRPGRFLPAPLNDRMPLEETTIAEALKTNRLRHLLCREMAFGSRRELLADQTRLRHQQRWSSSRRSIQSRQVLRSLRQPSTGRRAARGTPDGAAGCRDRQVHSRQPRSTVSGLPRRFTVSTRR